MLSLKSGIPIAHVIQKPDYSRGRIHRFLDDNDKVVEIPDKKTEVSAPKRLATIYVRDDLSPSAPPLLRAPPAKVLTPSDYQEAREKYRLSKYDSVRLTKRIKSMGEGLLDAEVRPSTTFDQALAFLKGRALHRLRTELDLSDMSPAVEIIPVIDMDKSRQGDPSVLLTGSSGSGKSSMIANLVSGDTKKRPVYLYTSLPQGNDPSLAKITETGRMSTIRMHDPESWLDASAMPGGIVIFDDTAFHPMSKDVDLLRDSVLETRRHHTDSHGQGITAICVSHGISQWRQTMCPHRECAHVILYPRSGKADVVKYLKNKVGLDKNTVSKLIRESLQHGRYLGVHTAYPSAAYTTNKITLL